MSAFKYLVFVLGVILVAVYGSIMLEVINPLVSHTQGQAETQAAETGAMWLDSFVGVIPLVLLGLLVFALIVGIVVRRNAVGGGGI